MDRTHAVVAFLLGVCTALATALVVQSGNTLPQAHAQSTSSGGFFVEAGRGTTGQSRDVIFLIDTANTRLAVYEYKDGALKVGAIRNIDYDMRFEEWTAGKRKQEPTVKEMKSQTEKEAGK